MSFNRTALIALLHYARDAQLELHDQLDEAEQNRAGAADNWSARDALTHCAEWTNRYLTNLETVEGGEPWPQGVTNQDIDAANLVIFKKHQGLSWDAVHTMIRETYARIDAYLESHDDAALLAPEAPDRPTLVWRGIAGNAAMHAMLHLWEQFQKRGDWDQLSALAGDRFATLQLAVDADDNAWRGTVQYNLACVMALTGQTDAALDRLAEALRLHPALTEWSQQDSDLDSLRDLPGYAALYE